MKKITTKINNSNECIENAQKKWEFLKYEFENSLLITQKLLLKKREKQRIHLELKLKNLESNLNSEENRKLYNHYKKDLETIYDYIVDGIKIGSKCEWYVHGEKSRKVFLNLEKKLGVQNRVRKLIVKEKEITDPKEILNNIKAFYETLFKQNSSKANVEKQEFLNSLDTKTLTNQQLGLCENEIRENDFFSSMKSMKNNKTPGNAGLTTEFYETFWDELKAPLMESIHKGKL